MVKLCLAFYLSFNCFQTLQAKKPTPETIKKSESKQKNKNDEPHPPKEINYPSKKQASQKIWKKNTPKTNIPREINY